MATNTGPGGATGATTPTGAGSGFTNAGVGPGMPSQSQPTITQDPTATPESAAADASARASLTAYLGSFGLGSLADWAWTEHLNGVPDEQIFIDMRSRPEYVARFPAMAALAQSGHAISESQYVEYERSAQSMFQAAGLPASFADTPDDFTAYLTGNVGLPELEKRISLAQQAAVSAPQAVRSELTAMYGIEDATGALTAYWLDPKKAAPILEQQFTAAQISAQAKGTGFGALTTAQAEHLAQLGVTEDAARQGLGSLAGLGQIGTETLAGEASLTKDEQLAAAFGSDAAAAAKIKTRQEQRTAAFQAGGGFTQGRTGQTGVGSAT